MDKNGFYIGAKVIVTWVSLKKNNVGKVFMINGRIGNHAYKLCNIDGSRISPPIGSRDKSNFHRDYLKLVK